jgi:hypothetical protein
LAQWYPTNDFDLAATNDLDRDGSYGWEEYIAGTHPTNANSVLELAVTNSGGQALVVCPTIAAGVDYDGKNRYYSLENRTNMQIGGWAPADGCSNILGKGQTIIYTNQSSVNRNYFRAKATLW